jgi:hypothetical protein
MPADTHYIFAIIASIDCKLRASSHLSRRQESKSLPSNLSLGSPGPNLPRVFFPAFKRTTFPHRIKPSRKPAADLVMLLPILFHYLAAA